MEFREREPSVRKTPWPCVVCGEECRATCTKRSNVRSVECSVCSRWCHEVCSSLTPDAFEYFERVTSTFVCGHCIEPTRNNDSYDIGFKRLDKSPILETVQSDVLPPPRDSHVVENCKAAERRAEKNTSGTATCHNLADEVQTILRMSETDTFIRRVFVVKDRVPSLVLYTDRQISDIKSFCFNRSEGSVLGFETIYNLAKLFVTISVYKNIALNRWRTKKCPVFLGPVFIHADLDFDTYYDFFGRLSAALDDCNEQQLTLGSDDDAAMTKCFRKFFPRAGRVACSLHIKKNVSRKLDDFMGRKSTARKPLLDALFGSTGLSSCDDVASLDAVVDCLRAGVLSSAPAEFVRYFDQKLLPLYQENIAMGPGFNKWTNNASKSMNAVLKRAVDWKLQELPDLIDCIRRLVDGQNAEADRAMFGLGDFVLQPNNARYRVSRDDWIAMSAEQRSKATKACFRIQSAGATVTSTDGNITVPATLRDGNIPGQTKRVRNVRTQSRAKKLCLNMASAQ